MDHLFYASPGGVATGGKGTQADKVPTAHMGARAHRLRTRIGPPHILSHQTIAKVRLNRVGDETGGSFGGQTMAVGGCLGWCETWQYDKGMSASQQNVQ